MDNNVIFELKLNVVLNAMKYGWKVEWYANRIILKKNIDVMTDNDKNTSLFLDSIFGMSEININ